MLQLQVNILHFTYLQLLFNLMYTQLPHWHLSGLALNSCCCNIPCQYAEEYR